MTIAAIPPTDKPLLSLTTRGVGTIVGRKKLGGVVGTLSVGPEDGESVGGAVMVGLDVGNSEGCGDIEGGGDCIIRISAGREALTFRFSFCISKVSLFKLALMKSKKLMGKLEMSTIFELYRHL
jgi:hypothetical protein